MSYFEDLTPYTYRHAGIGKYIFNIGWLDVAYPYQCGEVPGEFLDKLWGFVQIRVLQLRGFHTCNLCPDTEEAPVVVKKGDVEFALGDAEIRILGEAGKIYAAPNLIYHYVTVHNYRPPEEFVRAVLTGPGPDSKIYREFITKI